MTRNIMTRSNLDRFQLSGDRRAPVGPSLLTTQRCRASRSFAYYSKTQCITLACSNGVEDQVEYQGDLDDLEWISCLLGSVMITEREDEIDTVSSRTDRSQHPSTSKKYTFATVLATATTAETA